MASAKAVILIGGPSKGTRFRPLSLITPKPLFPIGNVPLIRHHVEACASLGENLSEILIIGFFEPQEFENFIAEASAAYSIKIRYLRDEEGLGTAGGLHKYREEIKQGLAENGNVFVLHGDILCAFPLVQLQEFHRQHSGLASVMATRVPAEKARAYGCIAIDDDTNEVVHYAEKPETFVSDVANCGVYVFSVSFFDTIASYAATVQQRERAHARFRRGVLASGDMRIRLEQDIFVSMSGTGKFFCFITDEWWTQLKHAGSPIVTSEVLLGTWKELHPEFLSQKQEDGPTIIGNVVIDPSATIHPTAVIGPNVTIGADVVIGSRVRVKQSVILPKATIHANACLLYCIIGWNSVVGEWARVEGAPDASDDNLRSGGITIFGEGVKLKEERIIRRSIVLPNKELGADHDNDIIL